MTTPADPKGRPARVFCVVSVVLGVVALAVRLAYEVSRADLGTDLGLADRGTQVILHWGALPIAVLGLAATVTAMAVSPTWRLRFGAPLPGLIVNGVALAWWFLG